MLVNIAPLRDVTKTRHIIGLASHYKKVVANFSNIVKTLTELKKNDTTFN